MYSQSMSGDTVPRIVEQWNEVRPDLDASPLLVVGRIQVANQLVEGALRPTFAGAGLARGDFNVLAALRRAGEPHTLTPSELRDALMVTQGAVTKQVDRLIDKGLVKREVSPDDARGRTVSLTRAGVALVDELMAIHLDNQRRLLSVLTKDEIAELGRLLAALTDAHDD
jgi:DNA-binding MarR family transcriptional regulator